MIKKLRLANIFYYHNSSKVEKISLYLIIQKIKHLWARVFTQD